jgi:hypothetical protein
VPIILADPMPSLCDVCGAYVRICLVAVDHFAYACGVTCMCSYSSCVVVPLFRILWRRFVIFFVVLVGGWECSVMVEISLPFSFQVVDNTWTQVD